MSRHPLLLAALALLLITAAPAVAQGHNAVPLGLQWQPLGEPGSGGRIDAIAVNPNDPDHVLITGDILGTAVSFTAGRDWAPTSGWDGWEHSDITFLPDQAGVSATETVLWAATLAGPYRSTDGGRTWTSKRAGMPTSTGFGFPAAVEKILVDPTDAQTLLAFGGDHRRLKDFGSTSSQVPNYGLIWRSVDGGESWSTSGMGSLPGNVMAVASGGGAEASSTIWAVVADDGLWRSDDLGAAGSWTKVDGGLPTVGGTVQMTGLVVDPEDPELVHVTVGIRQLEDDLRDGIGGVWRTEDGGASWVLVEPGDAAAFNPTNMLHIDRSADGSAIWAVDDNFGDGKGVYRSLDRGASWDHVLTQTATNLDVTDLGTPGRVGGWWVEVSESEPSTVYVGTSALVVRTEDNGRTWQDVLASEQFGRLSRGNGFTGWVANNLEFSPFDPDLLVAQGFDALLVGVSRDGGFSWDVDQPGLPPFGGGNDVAFADDDVIFAALGQGQTRRDDLVHRSLDGGVTWSRLSSPVSPAAAPGATGIHIDPAAADTAFLVSGGRLHRSDNALGPALSVTWNEIDVVPGVEGEVVSRLAPTSDPQEFYVATDAGVFVTRDFGATFRSTSDESGTATSGPTLRVEISVDPSDGDVLWAASDDRLGHGVYRYEATTGWTSILLPDDAERWARDVAVSPRDSRVVAVVTGQDPFVDINGGTGVWVSRDGGRSWATENANLPIERLNTATFSPDGSALFVGSGGRGFFRAQLGRPPLRIEAEHLTVSAGRSGVYTLAHDPAASGGRYLRHVGATGPLIVPDVDAPTASFQFTLDAASAAPQFWLRVNRTGRLFVRVDDGPWRLRYVTADDRWRWRLIGLPESRLGLSDGRHQLQIMRAAGPVRLDAVRIVP